LNFIDKFVNISPHSISRYLRLKGWEKRNDFPNERLIVFDGPKDMNGDRIQAVFPADLKYKDYPVRVRELVFSLSDIEGRAVEDIVDDIINPSVDRLQVRVLSDIAKSGTLPFSYAAKLVNGLKDFLVAAACVEENPQPFYRRATKIGLDYADNCRFGQTKYGSFIVTIESLVPLDNQLNLQLGEDLSEKEHFNRRVIKRIQRGLGQLETSVLEGDISPIIDNYKAGLNANMCEALLSLKLDQIDIDLEYSVDWSVGMPMPTGIPKKVKIEKTGFEYLESIAKVLRNSDESTRKEIVGKVVKLSASELEDDDQTGYGDRIVTIKTEIHDKTIRVNVPLTLGEYKMACDAHRDMREVKVIGMLERVGNQWQLMAPEDFRIVT
jgi:hypothetical protein